MKFLSHRQKSLPLSLLFSFGAFFGRAQCEQYQGLSDLAIDDRDHPKIALIGDTQQTSRLEFWRERNTGVTGRLVTEMARRRPAGVIHLGDLTFSGMSPGHWRHFDRGHRPLRDNRVPVFPILGNHEYYGWNETSLRNFFDRFPSLGGRTWHAFTVGRTGFVLINSNFGELGAARCESQMRWYLDVLERWRCSEEVDFIVVCSHHPPFTNSRVVAASPEVAREFAAPFRQHPKAAFFFSGHSHAYERFTFDGVHFVVSGGGGGPRHRLRVDSARQRYVDQFAGPPLRFFHFCELTMSPGRLDLEVIRLGEASTFDVAEKITILKEDLKP